MGSEVILEGMEGMAKMEERRVALIFLVPVNILNYLRAVLRDLTVKESGILSRFSTGLLILKVDLNHQLL